MTGLIFEKLEEVRSLRSVNSKYSQDYRISPDFNKISQIIDQYEAKYSKDLSNLSQTVRTLPQIKDNLTKNILFIYGRVQDQ